MRIGIIVAWYNKTQKDEFVERWNLAEFHDDAIALYLIEDSKREGTAITKNKGLIQAYQEGCDYFVTLDDDCFPFDLKFREFVYAHVAELKKEVALPLYEKVTEPKSRGTPYHAFCNKKKVAISMGFWEGTPDYDAYYEFSRMGKPEFIQTYFYRKYISLCGMNFAFTRKFAPLMLMPSIEHYDDIWMGWLAQKYIYDMGYCVSTNGPKIFHRRQSNCKHNLVVESQYLVENERLWQYIDDIKPIYSGNAGKDANYLRGQLVVELQAQGVDERIGAALTQMSHLT
jgi:hypothetical protein